MLFISAETFVKILLYPQFFFYHEHIYINNLFMYFDSSM